MREDPAAGSLVSLGFESRPPLWVSADEGCFPLRDSSWVQPFPGPPTNSPPRLSACSLRERKMSSEVLIGTVTDNNGLVINVWATESGGNTTFRIDVAEGFADLRGF